MHDDEMEGAGMKLDVRESIICSMVDTLTDVRRFVMKVTGMTRERFEEYLDEAVERIKRS